MHRATGGNPLFIGEIVRLAALLLSCGAPGDAGRARRLLTRVLETAERIGSHRLRLKATLLLERCPAEGRDEPHLAAGHEPKEAAGTPAAGDRGIFRREGEYWAIGHDGHVFRLRDSVGLRYLAELVTHPGAEFLASDLILSAHAAAPQAARSSPHITVAAMRRQGAALRRPGDGGAVLDPQARSAYRKRLADLYEERQDAQACNDSERTLRLRTEIEFLEGELTRALGLGGRERRATSDIERARVSVTRAIRAAVDKIARVDRPLGRYLRMTIKTGTFCSYCAEPYRPMVWAR